MNIVAQTPTDAPVGVSIAQTADAFAMLKEPDCAGVVWQRAFDADVAAWLEGQPPENLPRGRVILRPSAVEKSVGGLFDSAGTPDGPERQRLTADIADLARRFADMMEVDFIRLRLDAISHNACRKFHIDALTARLVCTYRGDGTQYGTSIDGDDPGQVFEVATGAPILLRGTLWPETPASGLRHRSPPIEGSGQTRLVLVLDPIFDPDQEQ